MIGAVTYELGAENSARVPLINGRLMHAVFFKILHEFSPELETFVHENLNIKPFTVSFLDPLKKIPSVENSWQVRSGDEFFWRVTGLNEEILNAALAIPIGFQIQVGELFLSVENINSKIFMPEEFISGVKKLSPVEKLEFKFLTPVTFKIDNFDAPYPRADLIFSSLADKWTQAQMPATVDKKLIKELAAQIRLTEWQGRSKKFYLAQDRGTLGFWGNFKFSLKELNSDARKVFMLLAKFGEYSGVGRLCAQGFGQTRINFQ